MYDKILRIQSEKVEDLSLDAYIRFRITLHKIKVSESNGVDISIIT